jgi:hypothetical protein
MPPYFFDRSQRNNPVAGVTEMPCDGTGLRALLAVQQEGHALGDDRALSISMDEVVPNSSEARSNSRLGVSGNEVVTAPTEQLPIGQFRHASAQSNDRGADTRLFANKFTVLGSQGTLRGNQDNIRAALTELTLQLRH